mmetsp:Transcript_7069/g.10817  ORF Transcript_7069/g.10817 Transcript_7069/m.10817 type:complete len:113 (-) Transcript_7069:216-554(-)
MAKEFAALFTLNGAPERVTTYLHVFVYHVGYFLVTFKDLEAVSNFSTEGTIQWVKVQTRNATSKFGGRNQQENSSTVQTLKKHNRLQPSFKQDLQKCTRRFEERKRTKESLV